VLGILKVHPPGTDIQEKLFSSALLLSFGCPASGLVAQCHLVVQLSQFLACSYSSLFQWNLGEWISWRIVLAV